MDAANRARSKRHVATFALAVATTALLAACGDKAAPEGLSTRVEISHVVGGQPLVLGQEVQLPGGEHLSVDRLRYYLGNFRLRRADGSWAQAARSDTDDRAYVLVDEAQPASRSFDIKGLAAGDYEGIEFVIGVDAARNTAGVQTGVLDPARGMFWTWNSGYIFFKLEGHSPESTAEGHIVEYHIGGARDPALVRTVYLPLGKVLKLTPQLGGTVHLHFDVAEVFQSPNTLRIAERATVMDAADGLPVADNYADAFRVDHVHLEPRH